MKTWILADAIACAAMGQVLVDCNIATAASLETAKITDVNIGQIKGQLKLTAAQQPHQQAGHVTAPDQCCSNVRKFLPWRRPHVTQSGHTSCDGQ